MLSKKGRMRETQMGSVKGERREEGGRRWCVCGGRGGGGLKACTHPRHYVMTVRVKGFVRVRDVAAKRCLQRFHAGARDRMAATAAEVSGRVSGFRARTMASVGMVGYSSHAVTQRKLRATGRKQLSHNGQRVVDEGDAGASVGPGEGTIEDAGFACVSGTVQGLARCCGQSRVRFVIAGAKLWLLRRFEC